MLQFEQVRDEVIKLLSDSLMITVTDSTTDLLESGLLDSAGLVDLLLHIETRFGVRLNLEQLDMADFRNCDSISNLIIANAPHPPARAESVPAAATNAA